MFEWITGPRMTNAIEDLKPDVGYENTIIDAPETPAHQFAVKAFKHAIFGTPAPESVQAANAKKLQKKLSPDAPRANIPEIAPPKEIGAPISPSKLPTGIMKTPVTANKARKSVSFPAHVVDNEGKRDNVTKSGLPNDCPGKFPSPWTPGTELKVGLDSEQKPRTKLTEALLDARTTKQPKTGQKPKARDDSDLTMDLGAPRSDSGKYWKEQYESYAARSEKEVKKLVAKQQVAKDFARRKDGEVTELATRLEGERKRHRRREQELEKQNRDYQERLRVAIADNTSASVEITALKNRIAALERSASSSSDVQESKAAIRIYEDTSKEAIESKSELDAGPEASYLSTKSRILSVGKENSPPKPRSARRLTLSDAPPRNATPFVATARLGVGDDQVSTIIARTPHARRTSHSIARPAPAPQPSKQAAPPVLSVRKSDYSKESSPPKALPKLQHSSPLPRASPVADYWMPSSEIEIGQPDKMALPIGFGGGSYSRPSQQLRQPARRPPRPRAERQKAVPQTDDIFLADAEPAPKSNDRTTNRPAPIDTKMTASTDTKTGPSQVNTTAKPTKVVATKPTHHSSTDPQFDVSKIATPHAGGSEQVTKDKGESGFVNQEEADRKAEVRRRLQERKKKKKKKETAS